MKDGKRIWTKLNVEERMASEEEKSLTRLIRENAEDSFEPFFSTRVMSRINANAAGEETFSQALVRIFRPVAVAAIVLIVALATYNISSQHALGNGRSPLETALALPAVTVETSIANFNFFDAL